jgi:tetrahydromethanopterin S-methyltransferase subunit B
MWRDAIESGGYMNISTNEVEKPTGPIWLATFGSRSAGRSSATKRPFGQAFFGVLVGLILAVAVILCVVSVIVVSHR